MAARRRRTLKERAEQSARRQFGEAWDRDDVKMWLAGYRAGRREGK